MGCFSFMCKMCDEAVLSNSFTGQEVNLFLLKDGKIIQHMEGEYDSYGKVFIKDRSSSIEWIMAWSEVCDLMFDEDDISNGIAAIHSKCFNKFILPITRSDGDPNQGWGEDGEWFCNDDEHAIIE